MASNLVTFGRTVLAALVLLHSLSGTARAGRASCATATESPLYAAIVVDANARRILHADKADELRHPASLTKVMTLYLLFEELEAGRVHMDTKFYVSEHATMMEPTKLDLEAGETLEVRDAILGLVTQSANDAAVVIAEALGGTEPEFAKRMTARARTLGMNNTIYCNASGLPCNNQVTTARDQAILGCAIYQRFPQFYHYFSTRSFVFHGRRMKNHNRLLGKVEGMDGIKTGYIRSSRFNLLASVRRNDRHLVAVVLGGSTARARDARMVTLIDGCIRRAIPQKTQIAAAPPEADATDEVQAASVVRSVAQEAEDSEAR
jgi:D-alanyl-D-alanine carboxypeptidase